MSGQAHHDLPTMAPYGQFPGPVLFRWLMHQRSLSWGAKGCYAQLVSHAGKGKDYCFPSRKTLAEELGMSIQQVDRYIVELVKSELIAVQREGNTRNNRYLFLQHPWVNNSSYVRTTDSSHTRTDVLTYEDQDSSHTRTDVLTYEESYIKDPTKRSMEKIQEKIQPTALEPDQGSSAEPKARSVGRKPSLKDRLAPVDQDQNTGGRFDGEPFVLGPDGNNIDSSQVTGELSECASTGTLAGHESQGVPNRVGTPTQAVSDGSVSSRIGISVQVSDLDLHKLKQVYAESHGITPGRYRYSALEEKLLRESIRSFGLDEAIVLVENLPGVANERANYKPKFFQAVIENICADGVTPSQWAARGRRAQGPIQPRKSMTEWRPGMARREDVERGAFLKVAGSDI